MEIQKHEHTHKNDLPDSIEIGTPSRLGAVKVYFNADNEVEAQRRIRNALILRKFMEDQIAKGEDPAQATGKQPLVGFIYT